VDNFFPVIRVSILLGKRKKRRKKSEIDHWGLPDKNLSRSGKQYWDIKKNLLIYLFDITGV
jgi:hypothetical protein